MTRGSSYWTDEDYADRIDLASHDRLTMHVDVKGNRVKLMKTRNGVRYCVFSSPIHVFRLGSVTENREGLIRAKNVMALLLRKLINLPILESRRAVAVEKYLDLMKELGKL